MFLPAMDDHSADWLRRVLERKLVQVLLLYVGVAWGVAEVTGFLVDNYQLSRRLLDVTLFLLVLGIPTVAIVTWFHGEKGHQRVQRSEAAILALLAVIAAVGSWQIGTAEPVETRDLSAVVDLGEHSVAVMPFDVSIPELLWLREGASELLTTGLAGHEGIRVVSGQRLYDLLRQEGHEDASEIPSAMASRLTRRAGARFLVDGSVLGSPEDLVLRADLVNVESGDVEASAQARGTDVFDLIDRIVADLSDQIAGEVVSSTELASVASVTTRNPDAYREYLRGLLAQRRFRLSEAMERFRSAVALDSTFALAHMRLANVAMNSGDLSLGIQSLRSAREYRDFAPERDRLFLDAALAQALNQDTRESRRILDSLVTLYPDDKEARFALARLYPQNSDERLRLLEETVRLDPFDAEAFNGLAYARARRGDFEAADTLIRRYVELEPNEPNPRDSRGEILMMAGRHEAAREAFREALALHPGFEPSLRHLAESWAAEERFAEGRAELRTIIDTTGAAASLPAYMGLATLHAHEGGLSEALSTLEAYRERADGLGDRGAANTALTASLPFLVALQEWERLHDATEALAEADPLSPFPSYTEMLSLAERGDLDGAVATADSIMAFVRSTEGLLQFEPLMQAVTSRELAFYAADHERSIDWNETVRETGGWPEFGSYAVARSLLALARYEEAQEHAWRIGSFSGPAQALAERLRLYYVARALEGLGQTERAIATYERLLAHRWRRTVATVPLVRDAPERLAKLRERSSVREPPSTTVPRS